MKTRTLTSGIALAVAMLAALPATAQTELAPQGAEEAPQDTIIVTGTRRANRSVLESTAPIDVLSSRDLEAQSTGDMTSMMRSLIPSFNVGRFVGIASDGSGFVRPPTLRGLPPDQILVLVNGKRRHRSALVSVAGGGGLTNGSQGPDVAQIPSIAIERIEVLRDGASAQYGSDAIAGVINYNLRTADSGIDARTRYGQYYKNDGQNYQAAVNIGVPLGSSGFMNVSGEFLDSDYTSRGGQRIGAQAVQSSFPDMDIRDPVQKVGDPKVRAYRLFFNSGLEFGDGSEIYLFGNYGVSRQSFEFNWRQPVDAMGISQDGTGMATYAKSSVFNTIYLDQLPDGTWDVDGRTFSFLDLYPNGFVPIFKGKVIDSSLVGGYRGELESGITYDLSASYGQSRVEYYMNNSLNASMGPDSPTDFHMGALEQRETNFNADFTYPVELGLASPITIAFGAEHRAESYEIGLGDYASYAAGPYTVQTLSDGSVTTQAPGVSGFPGYSPNFVVNNSRRSYAGYLDIEGDIFDGFTLGLAGRYEHFSDFGSTTNGKVSARYAFSPAIALRGTVSTGFRAPTPGQLFTTAGVTGFRANSPTEFLTLPAHNPAAIALGSKPLTPERSTNFSGGLVLTPGGGFNVTVDYYNVTVRDRLGTATYIEITTPEQREMLRAAGLANWATVGNVRYFANGFKTRTQGVDFTASHTTTTGIGRFDSTLALNYNSTKVLERDLRLVDDVRKGNIEDLLPKWRITFTENWSLGRFSLTARGYYYGAWTNWALPADGGNLEVGAEFIADLEVRHQINDNFTVAVGADNILNNYPDLDIRSRGLANSNWYESTQATVSGSRYADQAPFGYNGGFWYVRLNASF